MTYFFVDADDFLTMCGAGRKLCYFIPLYPGHNPLTEFTPINFQTTSACVYNGKTISYDPIENAIYWSDYCRDVYRTSLNNGSKQLLIRKMIRDGSVDVEIDVIGRNIYIADPSADNIRVATLDGSYQAVVIKIQSPWMLALDSVSR